MGRAVAKQVEKLSQFGDLIERFLREPYPESATGVPYARTRIGFMEFVLQEAKLDKFALQKAIGLPRVNYNNWMDANKTIRRETLDNITQFHQLTPQQEIGLWSIAGGDLSLPSPQEIARELQSGATAFPVTLPDTLTRGTLRVNTLERLCARTGLSLDKLRDLASERALMRSHEEPYSKALNATLTTPKHEFHNVRTARIWRVPSFPMMRRWPISWVCCCWAIPPAIRLPISLP